MIGNGTLAAAKTEAGDVLSHLILTSKSSLVVDSSGNRPLDVELAGPIGALLLSNPPADLSLERSAQTRSWDVTMTGKLVRARDVVRAGKEPV